MTYSAEINRANPACIIIIIDQSTSMGARIDGGRSKASFLADVVNKTLCTLITTSSKADGVRDYFYVGVIAYSGGGAANGFLERSPEEGFCGQYPRLRRTHPGSKFAAKKSRTLR
jgi:hypothetical protein